MRIGSYIGMLPRKGTFMSFASVSPPPLPKMSLSVRQVGQMKWLMFSMSPSGGTFSYLAFDAGKYTGAGTPDEFMKPFLQGYLVYVRAKK